MSNKLEQFRIQIGKKILGFRNMQEKLEKNIGVSKLKFDFIKGWGICSVYSS